MTQAALRLRLGGADHEARLARAAATGHGRAFATLYDRYERRVFNLAYRITGSPDHAARATREAFLDAVRALPPLNGGEPRFGSGLLTATRNASYELIERDALAPPAGTGEAGTPDGHDRDLVFEAEQERIRAASLRLGAPEREALALKRLGDLPYGEIAEIMDIRGGSLPALIAGARVGLHDELFGTDLASGTSLPEECEQALPLMAMRDDGQLSDEEDFQWLLDHLAHCGDCRVRLDAMQRAAAAYDGWEPLAAPPALFEETMAAAAESGSADWSEAIDEWRVKRSPGRVPGGVRGIRGRAGLGPAMAAASHIAADALDSLQAAVSRLASGASRRRPARNRLVTIGLLCLVLLGLSGIGAGAAIVLRSDDRPQPTGPSAASADRLSRQAPARVQRPVRRPRTGLTPKPKKVRTSPQSARVIPQSVVVVGARPEAQRPQKAPDKSRRRKAQRRRRTPQAQAVPLTKPTPPPPASQPAPTQPPAGTTPQPQPAPSGCKDPAGKPVPCPG